MAFSEEDAVEGISDYLFEMDAGDDDECERMARHIVKALAIWAASPSIPAPLSQFPDLGEGE